MELIARRAFPYGRPRRALARGDRFTASEKDARLLIAVGRASAAIPEEAPPRRPPPLRTPPEQTPAPDPPLDPLPVPLTAPPVEAPPEDHPAPAAAPDKATLAARAKARRPGR